MAHLTPNRNTVYTILKKHETPLDASSLILKLQSIMDKATVYRSLKFLEEKKYIESFTYNCKKDGERRYYIVNENNSHFHYFHCEKCHCFIEIDDCNPDHYRKLEKKYRVKIQRHTVQYSGLCSKCSSSM